MSRPAKSPATVIALREAVADLNAAVIARDYEAITQRDHQLRNAAMAAVGGLSMRQKQIDETETVLVEAINAVRGAAKYLQSAKRRDVANLSRQERVRLVYSKKGD